jgi:hypothetical protein
VSSLSRVEKGEDKSKKKKLTQRERRRRREKRKLPSKIFSGYYISVRWFP